MTLPLIARGDLGVRIDVPADWTLLQDQELAAVWRTPRGALVLASHLPEPVEVGPDLVDDLRHDLRLIAAARGGGLAAGDVDAPAGLAAGFTLEPRLDGPGLTAVGRALVPTATGHASLSVVAHGPGEAGGEGVSGADPHGFRYDPPAPLPGAGLEHAPWPARLRLALPQDAGPEHPLTIARDVLGALLQATTITAPPPARHRGETTLEGGVRFDLPPGVLPAAQGRLKHGQLFRRVTFEKRVAFLTVCRHPSEREVGRSPAAARRLVEQHLAWARTRPLRGPRVEPAVVGGKACVLAEHEVALGGAEDEAGAAGAAEAPAREVRGAVHATYAVSAFLPWEDHTIEVSCMGETDDWPRAQRDLERVVGSLRSASRPQIVPDTTRISGEVTPAGRRRIYRLLCTLARGAGTIDPPERAALEGIREQLAVTSIEAAELEAEAERGERLDLSKNPAEQGLLLDAMIEVVAADGCLDHEEQRRVLEIAETAGIPRATVTERLLGRLTGP